MSKKIWYNIKSSQTWLNLMQAEAVFRNGNMWSIRMRSGNVIDITENEYWDIVDLLRGSAEHEAR